MNITIHKGTNQIGACITEVESGGYKVFIDFGEQLPGTQEKELSPIDGLTCGDVSKSALFITHYHGDHIGKICETHPELPIYIGKTAFEIYNSLEKRLSYIPEPDEAEKHIKIAERLKTVKTFDKLQLIKIGDIEITPLMVDHSAFDAYMFIIQAENKRVLHTGDFRMHGFRGKGLLPTLKTYAKNIDYLITEGSNINRPNVAIQTEQELQKEFEKLFRKNKYNFILLSSTNIDRIFGLYHAAKKAGRCFVCDKYQEGILKIVSDNHKQYTPFYDIDYEPRLNPAGRFFSLLRKGGNHYTFKGNLKRYLDKYGFCMLIRGNNVFKPLMDEYAKSENTQMYYSMWDGYLDVKKPAYNKYLHNFLKPYNYEVMHTSGHADIDTLRKVFQTVKPRSGIIPIHTDSPERFNEVFAGQNNIILLKDGDVLDCNNKTV